MQPSAPPRRPGPKPGSLPPGSPAPVCAPAPAGPPPPAGAPAAAWGWAKTAPGMLTDGASAEAGCWLLCSTSVCAGVVSGADLMMLDDGTALGGPASGAGIGGASGLGASNGFGAGAGVGLGVALIGAVGVGEGLGAAC